MSQERKAELARLREQKRAVRNYLAALDQQKKAGRKLDPDTVRQRIEQTQSQIAQEADIVRRLDLIQKRLDLECRLDDIGVEADLDALENDFTKAAKEYSDRKGITYTAWREVGVPAAILKRSGISRTRRTTTT